MASSAVRIRQVPTGIWAMRLDAAGGAQLEMSSECSVEQCGLLLIYVDSGFQLRHMDTGMVFSAYSSGVANFSREGGGGGAI